MGDEKVSFPIAVQINPSRQATVVTDRQSESTALVWNASSGWVDSRGKSESIRSILSSRGSAVHLIEVKGGIDVVENVKLAVATGTGTVIAAGGDGTVNAVASALLYRQAALGIIPAGTLNHLARDLNLPLDEEEAARALVSGSEISIDAGMVNGHVFVNNSVLGFFPYYRHLRERLERCCLGSSKAGRFVAVLVGLCIALWRLPRLTVTYDVNGSQRSLRTPFVLIGNNEHRMQGFALGARSVLNSGLLWVYVMRPHTRWQLLTRVIGVLLGRIARESLFEVFSSQHITIESSRRRLGVGVDGEVVDLKTPLHYESLPGALRVLVPHSEAAS